MDIDFPETYKHIAIIFAGENVHIANFSYKRFYRLTQFNPGLEIKNNKNSKSFNLLKVWRYGGICQ